MSSETFGQRLKRLRERAGLSQAQLASTADVPIGTLRGAEYDRREPLVGTANKLALALGVSLDALVGTVSPGEHAPSPIAPNPTTTEAIAMAKGNNAQGKDKKKAKAGPKKGAKGTPVKPTTPKK